jgi:hypothetical protein
MNNIKKDRDRTFKLFALTLVLPLTLPVMNLLFVGILGLELKYGFLLNFKIIWIDYYFTGSFLDIVAWKWQLGLLFCSFLLTKFVNLL